MPTLLCDLDGVLADFAAGVAALVGKEPPGAAQASQDTASALGLRDGQLWNRVDEAGQAFWERLQPTAEADALVGLLREAGDLVLVTAPSSSPASAAGKMRWVQKRFGRRFRDLVITARKDLLAGPDRLLIDDRPATVDRFREAGGAAVLYPTWENGLRSEHPDPVATVAAAIAAWKETL